MSKVSPPAITTELREMCSNVVYAVAAEYRIPPVFVTAHIRTEKAVIARRKVMSIMLTKFGMRRYQVAEAFGRDIRRVRKSVIGA
jgi:chromosomal replication initiation ATPase DnaA